MQYFVYAFLTNPNRFGYVLTDINNDLKLQNYFYNNVFDKWIKLNDEQLKQYMMLLDNNNANLIHENYLVNMYLPYMYKGNVYFGSRHLMEGIYERKITGKLIKQQFKN
jgi:hypothetical protein